MIGFTGTDDQIIDQLVAYKIVAATQKEDMAVLLPLIRRLELSALDYMTLRDLVDFGDYQQDPELALALMAMFALLQEGSLCLDLDQQPFPNLVPTDETEMAMALFGGFLSSLAKGRYENLITRITSDTRGGAAYLPLVLDESGGRRLLYFQKYHVHEKQLKHRLEALLNAPVSLSLGNEKIDSVLEEIYAPDLSIRVGQRPRPIAKDPVQLEAIRLVLKSQFAIISGGPGTGKTSLLVNILRCLVREGVPVSRIILGAPTGRAAQRMTETVQNNIATIQAPTSEDLGLLDLRGSTLHKILGYRSRRHEFYYRKTNPLPAAVVVIDEVSMIDVVMLDTFLQAVDPGQTKLVFLGDKDQLPSVEAGAVLADMIPDEARATGFQKRFVVLQKVYRSGTHLLALATQANKGALVLSEAVTFDQALSQGADQWAFVRAQGFGQWQRHLHQWAAAHYLSPSSGGHESYADFINRAGELAPDALTTSEEGRALLDHIFRVVEKARILSILRQGIFGCTVISDLIAERLIPFCDPGITRASDGFSGAMIIITRNDYSKELFNGDVGVIIKDVHQTYKAFFQRADTYFSFPVNLLPSWELAFAMTVHKSQGSEFDDVVLVLPDDDKHRLLTREIVYTGITRARKRVVLYGSARALQTALHRKMRRQSGLVLQ